MAKAKEIARLFMYLAESEGREPIEKTSLNKLLYYAQGYMLKRTGKALFNNQIDAWQHGPVVSVVYSNYERIKENEKNNGINGLNMSAEEIETVLDVWKAFRNFSAHQLVEMTHEKGAPWETVYDPEERNKHIPLEMIKEYFEQADDIPGIAEVIRSLPTVDKLPAEDYDPEEDAVWEEQYNAAL